MTKASTSTVDRGSSRNAATLITGAGGEVGHGLISSLNSSGRTNLVGIDIREIDKKLRNLCRETFVADICDSTLVERLQSMFEITEVYHLAALLSTRAEFTPEAAHDVNVGGTINLLRLAADQARSHGQRVKFLLPSSIAAHGFNNLAEKTAAKAVKEDEHTKPITMYGCNKLYCENLGRYYAKHYRQLAKDRMENTLDFRCLRYPGLISAETVPSGGTSDFAPEMIHAAAEGKAYACFVRPDTRIPFMTMPEAVEAILKLAAAEESQLTRCVYNVASFSASAEEIADLVREYFPGAEITFEPDKLRQVIVDTWPAYVDDSVARKDWGWEPTHDLRSAFEEYVVPGIKKRYA